jgi:hypothetical protein
MRGVEHSLIDFLELFSDKVVDVQDMIRRVIVNTIDLVNMVPVGHCSGVKLLCGAR